MASENGANLACPTCFRFFFGGFKSTVHEKVLRGMCYVPALFDKNIPSQVLWNLASHQALTSKYKGTGTWLNHVESKNQRLQMTKSGHRCLAGWLHPLSLQCTPPSIRKYLCIFPDQSPYDDLGCFFLCNIISPYSWGATTKTTKYRYLHGNCIGTLGKPPDRSSHR